VVVRVRGVASAPSTGRGGGGAFGTSLLPVLPSGMALPPERERRSTNRVAAADGRRSGLQPPQLHRARSGGAMIEVIDAFDAAAADSSSEPIGS